MRINGRKIALQASSHSVTKSKEMVKNQLDVLRQYLREIEIRSNQFSS